MLLLAFGHKDGGEGQRYILSYDEGASWSNTVFDLHVGGLYASSVALADGTVVTAFACPADSQSACKERAGRLSVLRWRLPPRGLVEAGGFFAPTAP